MCSNILTEFKVFKLIYDFTRRILEMKTFSMINLFTIFCLLSTLLLAANLADVHAQGESALKVTSDTGPNTYWTVGEHVWATFTAENALGKPVPNARLRITYAGFRTGVFKVENSDDVKDLASNASLADIGSLVSHGSLVTVGSGATATRGSVTLAGTIDSEAGAWIQAVWEDEDQTARASFQGSIPRASVLIVVNSPEPKDLSVGSTFTQEITIENHDPDWPTFPLTAWQMDIVFNPNILEVTNVAKGNFLEDSEKDALFLPNLEEPVNRAAELARINLKGRINASQALYDTTTPNAGVTLPKKIDNSDQHSKTLLTIEFKVLEYAEEALGIHNVLILTNSDTDPEVDDTAEDKRTPDRISYAILVKDVFVATVHYSYNRYDVNQDGMINILDLVLAASSIGTHNLRADVNDDGIVNVLDLVEIAKRLGQSPGKTRKTSGSSVNEPPDLGLAPSASRNINPATIQSWIDLARIEDNGSEMFKRGITNLEALLNSKVPTKTKLLLNYPNPFNPETWIPYQLAESANVTVMIYSMNGNPIRTLKLGHQSAGTYINKNQAAYWDGRNELGEQAASGVYFYTFTAGKFSATGKMLIRK